MRAVYIESVGDGSAGIYAIGGDKLWHLLCIVNPSADMHSWPRTGTQQEMNRWRSNCTHHEVKIIRNVERAKK
jgi:hypothetical protein